VQNQQPSKIHQVLFVPALLGTVLLLAACSNKNVDTVNIVGSSSVQPFVELLAEEYLKKYPEENVEVQGGGSTAGLQAVVNRLADIGMSSRLLTQEESMAFESTVIALDGLAVVVNPANPVSKVTSSQLRDIFSGTIGNWKDLGGEDRPIRPISREEGSGSRDNFGALVMEELSISRRALTQESNGAVRELVKGDRSAIGYISLSMVSHELKALLVDGEAPTLENIQQGLYTLTRPFLFVTQGEPAPSTKRFFEYCLSAEGQEVLEKEGLVRKP
jgi:phosphate transport system substrate-binding protein